MRKSRPRSSRPTARVLPQSGFLACLQVGRGKATTHSPPNLSSVTSLTTITYHRLLLQPNISLFDTYTHTSSKLPPPHNRQHVRSVTSQNRSSSFIAQNIEKCTDAFAAFQTSKQSLVCSKPPFSSPPKLLLIFQPRAIH